MKSEILNDKGNNQPSYKSIAQHVYNLFKARSSKDDEFNDWAGYRDRLTDFVIDCIAPGESLLILGAGKCNDLDLKKLAAHCGSITLSDYRPETADEAFARYGLTPSDKLKFVASDYVGITDEDYLEYTERLLKIMERLSSGQEEIDGPDLEALKDCLERIYQNNEDYEIDLGDEMYDHAVITGVHSQLNNSFRGLFQYVRKDVEDRIGEIKSLEELNAAIFRTTRKHTKYLVNRFNEAVFAVVRNGVLYGYEKNIIYTPSGSDQPVIGTVDGARQAGELIASLPVKKNLDCIWPLSRRRGIKFTMSICYLDLQSK